MFRVQSFLVRLGAKSLTKASKARGGGHCQQQIDVFGPARGHAVHPGCALAEDRSVGGTDEKGLALFMPGHRIFCLEGIPLGIFVADFKILCFFVRGYFDISSCS